MYFTLSCRIQAVTILLSLFIFNPTQRKKAHGVLLTKQSDLTLKYAQEGIACVPFGHAPSTFCLQRMVYSHMQTYIRFARKFLHTRLSIF